MKTMMKTSPRHMAVQILNRVERNGAYAEPLLDDFLSKNELANIHDRKLLTQIVYGTLRMRGHLDWIIQQIYRGNFALMNTEVKNILRTAMFQIWFTDRIPDFAIANEAVEMTKIIHPTSSGLVNAIIRNAIRKKAKIRIPEMNEGPARHISISYSHPLWLVERWIDMFGIEETLSLCRANNEVPSSTLRINRLKATREQAEKALKLIGIDTAITPFSPDGLVASNMGIPIRETELYKAGWIQLQDEASQEIAYLVHPQSGENILDLCAGTGGKAIHMAEMMRNQGRITAIDRNANKTASLKENANRQGIDIVNIRTGDATKDLGKDFHESFDRILLDAPCSGLGTLRRNPEIKWRISKETLTDMVRLQRAILKKAALYLKKGGWLIYSTCSVMTEENEHIIDDFISQNRSFILTHPPETIDPALINHEGYFMTCPHRHGMDGFFGAVLLKK